MQSIAILFLMTSCLNLIVVADKQSALTASSNFDASPAQISQRQQPHQQLQQQLSSRTLPTDEQIASSEKLHNDSHYQLLKTNRPSNGGYHSGAMSDHSYRDGSVNSDSYHVNKIHYSHEDDNRYNFKSYIEDLLRNPVKNNRLLPPSANSKPLFENNYFSGYTPYWSHSGRNESNQQREDHHLDKREVAGPLTTGEDLPDEELEDNYYPILLDRRFQVFRSNDPFTSAPYLSAQEFKETFRRSDPYVVGKRTRDLFDDVVLPFSTDKRAAPKFIGRRDSPYFVGKRDAFDIPEGYLEDLALEEYNTPLSEEYNTPLTEDKRAAPRFIGRRGAPYFVGKRGAPMFIGKRDPIFTLQDDDLLSLEDKRGSPRFVGKRRAPFFVGKREYPYNIQPSLSDLPSDRELQWLLEKKGSPKFVGRRGPPYFVGKRGAPMFIGKRASVSDQDSDSVFGYGQSEASHLLGRRGPPYFVGKRGTPKFIGKRWAEPKLQEHASTEEKRRAPKFVGRRGSPFFVGKRESDLLGGDGFTVDRDGAESHIFSELKRAAPRFVGKRQVPYFVGKRGPPKFVGKRLADGKSPNSVAVLEEQRPAQFVDRRASPFFVGKKAAPMFVGKRLLNSIDDNNSERKLESVNGNFKIENSSN